MLEEVCHWGQTLRASESLSLLHTLSLVKDMILWLQVLAAMPVSCCHAYLPIVALPFHHGGLSPDTVNQINGPFCKLS